MNALSLGVEHVLRMPPHLANSGGPRSRTRTERIRSTLLGNEDGFIRCPRTIRLGLRFDRTHPVSCLESLLDEAGFASPEDLRDEFTVPAGPLICRPWTADTRRVSATRAPGRRVLQQALMLGLCTAQVFDPGRPVLWTEASVTRVLELFDPAGFYA